jgi:plastocyanin
MRRLVAAMTMAGALAAAPVAADPGHGPIRVEIGANAFTPTDLRIVEGDLVIWEWRGPDTNHSVTADDGQTFTFDSDPEGTPAHEVGATYAVTFDQPGTWSYHCKVHPGMTGRVTVVSAGPGAVQTAPTVSNVKLAVAGRRLTVRYALDEPARLRARVRRASGGAFLLTKRFGVPPGAGKRVLKLGGLAAGRYALAVTALDATTGKPANTVRRTFTLR